MPRFYPFKLHYPATRLLFAFLVCAIIGAGCGKKSRENPEEHRALKVGITTSFLGEATTFMAEEKGFFKDHGLDVTLKHNPSGSVSIRDLFNGEVDIAHVAETPVVYALMDSSYYQNGEVPSFQIFGDMIYADEIQKIIARKDHGINGPKDLAGKRVAIYSGTQLDYYLDSFLLEHQIPKKSLTLVNMEPIAQVEAIKNGEVDAAVNWEPYASYISRELGDRAVEMDTELTYSTLWMTATLDAYAESNPDLLVAYLESIREAQNYIKEHPAEARELLARHTGISIEIIKSLWDEIDFELSLSERLLTLLEDQARWMIRNNIADTSDYDFQQIINFTPMRAVNPEGITVIQ